MVTRGVAKKTRSHSAGVAATRKAASASAASAQLAKRKLLEAKQHSDRQAVPWQVDANDGQVSQSGFQSPQAAQKANDLHAAESRMQGIHGSIATGDRHAQGKRDKR